MFQLQGARAPQMEFLVSARSLPGKSSSIARLLPKKALLALPNLLPFPFLASGPIISESLVLLVGLLNMLSFRTRARRWI